MESRSADRGFDMEIEEDLVEEVARVYGYNNIPDEPTCAGLIGWGRTVKPIRRRSGLKPC